MNLTKLLSFGSKIHNIFSFCPRRFDVNVARHPFPRESGKDVTSRQLYLQLGSMLNFRSVKAKFHYAIQIADLVWDLVADL